jgi:phospholipase C
VADADGSQQQTYTDPAGNAVPTRHFSTLGTGGTEYKGCGHPDPGHGWDSGRAELRGGFLAEGSGNDEFALTYFNSGDLGFIHDAARAYTLYDRFFCSLLASTWPNRYYEWSAQSGGLKDNDPPVGTAGNQWETIFDRALGRGLSARYYASDLPFSAVWGPRGAAWTNPDHALLRGLRGGHAPEHRLRRPAVQGRRRGRRPLRRRAPTRRRATRAGLHGRRGERLRALAELPPRRALRDLRRVGWLSSTT